MFYIINLFIFTDKKKPKELKIGCSAKRQPRQDILQENH
tara:strand:- start:533 stop:649 length:117 start_codon:yes stop_codon:yes gene_type:complete